MGTRYLPCWIITLTLLLGACSDDGEPVAWDKSVPDAAADTSTPDVALDSSAPDLTSADVTVVDQTVVDAADPDGSNLTLLTNENPCKTEKASIIPDAKEFGHLFAVRLTPKTYPFTVTNLRYTLSRGKDSCANVIAHRVEVYVSSKTTPDNSPTIKATINVPATTVMVGARLVTLTLPTPIKLQTGEHIFVAVEMATDKTKKVICMDVCDKNGTTDRNYWSNATKPPYKWATLASFGMKVNAMIEALGY